MTIKNRRSLCVYSLYESILRNYNPWLKYNLTKQWKNTFILRIQEVIKRSGVTKRLYEKFILGCFFHLLEMLYYTEAMLLHSVTHWRECRQTGRQNLKQASTYGTLSNRQTQGWNMHVCMPPYAHSVLLMHVPSHLCSPEKCSVSMCSWDHFAFIRFDGILHVTEGWLVLGV